MLESPIRPAMRSPLQQAMDRIGSAPAVWTPATLFAASEQGVWYDPSDFSTLFQDSAGTVPVTATGQVVGKMLDKSGRGNHATQATTASKPILQQDGNGKYYLAFDGVDDIMATAAVNFTATDKMSVFAGASMLATNGTVASWPGSFNFGGRAVLYAGASSVNRFSVGSAGVGAFSYAHSASSVVPRTAVLAGQMSISGPLVWIRENGLATVSNTNNQGTGNYTNDVIYLGASGAGERLNGRIYQLIIRGALTDAAGITAAETFANTKTAAY